MDDNLYLQYKKGEMCMRVICLWPERKHEELRWRDGETRKRIEAKEEKKKKLIKSFKSIIIIISGRVLSTGFPWKRKKEFCRRERAKQPWIVPPFRPSKRKRAVVYVTGRRAVLLLIIWNVHTVDASDPRIASSLPVRIHIEAWQWGRLVVRSG